MNKMKLAVDGMGGDNAPQAIVEGVLMALEDFKTLEVQLYGDEQKMAPYVKQHERLQVIHCTEVVEGEEKWNKIKNIKVGDTYTFGAYEQDHSTSNGKEAIEWTVLDKDGMT